MASLFDIFIFCLGARWWDALRDSFEDEEDWAQWRVDQIVDTV